MFRVSKFYGFILAAGLLATASQPFGALVAMERPEQIIPQGQQAKPQEPEVNDPAVNGITEHVIHLTLINPPNRCKRLLTGSMKLAGNSLA